MKEFVKTQKVTYNLMSFTGFKALLIFDMLTEGPKSFDEIQPEIGMNTDELLTRLTEMELHGLIEQSDGERYRRGSKYI